MLFSKKNLPNGGEMMVIYHGRKSQKSQYKQTKVMKTPSNKTISPSTPPEKMEASASQYVLYKFGIQNLSQIVQWQVKVE